MSIVQMAAYASAAHPFRVGARAHVRSGVQVHAPSDVHACAYAGVLAHTPLSS